MMYIIKTFVTDNKKNVELRLVPDRVYCTLIK